MSRSVSLKTIEAKIKRLQVQASALKRAEKAGIKELRSLVTKYHLTPGDVRLAIRVEKRNSLRGRKVKPKYRNPDKKTETWAGRGLQPRWLRAALKKGKRLSDFAIPQ